VLAEVAAEPHPIGPPDSVHPELLRFVGPWFERDGVAGASIAVTAGALDGIERVLWAHLRTGDRVLVEDPGYPPIRDIVSGLGLVPVPVAIDERGLVPGALAQALESNPSALTVVPRGQNPTGAALDADRAAELRTLLASAPELLIAEDDHLSLVSGSPFHSTIAADRRRWALVRSVSKMLHPDLRLAVVAGDETTIGRLDGRQMLGPGWVSHILQATAARMLNDNGFLGRCELAAHTYRARREAMIDALAERGIRAFGSSGLNVWVPVPEEATVVRALSDAGWLVLAGERFRSATAPAVRITIATLRDREAPRLAGALAELLYAVRPRAGY
jgi:DNA-binding transcriptional MocR family regulator